MDCNYLFTFKNSPYFLVNFVISVLFHYFTFCFKFYFPIADIIVNHLYILFLRSRKTNTKCDNKKRKKSVARNIVASKKYFFLIFVRLDLVVLKIALECKIFILNLAESVIMTNRLNLV